MKRKLSALLAIVLAVVMVFPTAVFVGAEELTPALIKGTVTNYLIADLVEDDEWEIKNDETFQIPTHGVATLKVEAPEGFTFDNNFPQWESGGVASKNGSFDTERKTGTFQIRGTAEGKDTLLFSATKPEKDSVPAVTITYRVNVEVVQPSIMVDDIVVTLTRTPRGGTPEKFTAYDNMGLDPYDELTVVGVDVPLNNGVDLAEVTNVEARIAIYKDAYNFDGVDAGNTVSAFGGHKRIAVNLRFEDTRDYGSFELDDDLYYDVIVRAKEIASISIEPAPNETFLPSDTLEASDVDRIVVIATYTDGSNDELDFELCGIYNVADNNNNPQVSNPVSEAAAIEKAKQGKATADNFEDYLVGEAIYIVVRYDNKYEAIKATSILDFSNPIPTDVVIELMSNAKKDYISGQILGDEGWNGVKITVKYADGVQEKVYYNENGGKIGTVTYPGITTMKGTLEIKPFVYGDNTVKFTYNENNTELTRLFKLSDNNVTVEKKIVERLEIANTSGVKVSYVEDEKLDLTGLTLNVYYNSGEKEEVSYADPKVECSPNHRDALTTDIDEVLIVYTCVDEETDKEYSVRTILKIDVYAKEIESTIKEVILVADGNKTEYFIGESFEKDGYRLFVTYNDNTPSKYVNLSECTAFGITDTTKYKNGEFIKAFSGSLGISFKLPSTIDSKKSTYTLTLEDITVTKRPVLQSIVATSSKDTYMVGDAPEVQEITITAKYDDNSTRVFRIAEDTTDANKVKTTYTITTGGVTYTMKLTPNRIDEDTTDIRVTYTEKITGGTTTTKYYDVEIEVIVPEAILSYYDGGWKYEPYMDFDEALDAAEEYAETLTSSYLQSRKPSIQLCKDITVLYDYSVTEYMEIDLNGFDLTMYPGEIFVKSTSSAEITFVNNGDEDSQIIYSKTNDDDNIIIGEDDSYVIDADSGDGKYEITITKPTNGKVTGPQEVTHGHDVKFTITPNEDYEVKTITVKEGKSTKKYDNKDNVVTVEDVQGALTITVTFQEKAWENPFSDVYKSATYYKSIQFVYENGLFSGMSATKFEPDTTMTRAMFVTVLGRLAGIDAEAAAARYGNTSIFSDVSASDASIAYAVPYIKWATDNGLIEGYGNGKFGPKDNITHIQMYVLMQRYAAFIERLNTSAVGANIPANDVKDIPTWDGAYEAVEYAAKHQFLVTSSNRLTPNGNAKRSELAVLLEKFCTNVLDWDN